MATCEEILSKAGLSPQEILNISDSIQSRIDAGHDWMDIIKDINLGVKDAEFEANMASVGIVKKASVKQEMLRKIFGDDDFVRNFKAFLTGSTRKKEGFLYSVGTMQRAKLKTLHGKIFAETGLSSRAIRKMLGSKSFQQDLVKELYPFDGVQKTNNDLAFTMAKSIADAKQKIIVDLNRSGVAVRYRANHVATQWHDPYKLSKASKEKWIQDIRGLIDWDKTQPKSKMTAKDGTVIMTKEEAIDDYLGKVFDERTKAANQYDTSKFRLSESASEQFQHSRELIFKDSESWMAYNEMYGHASPIHAIFNDLEVQSNRSVLIDFMGPDPKETFEEMMNQLEGRLKKEGKELSAWDRNALRSRMAQITGEAFIVGKPGIAKIINTISGLNILSKLGKATLSSVTDVATAAMSLNHMGVNVWDSYTKVLTNVATNVSEAERKYIYRMLGVGADTILGSAASRFTIDDAIPGIMSKAVDNFFHINGLNAWTDWAREGFSKMASMHFAKNLKTSWAKLDASKAGKDFKRVLVQYGIDETDWNKLQQIGSFKISDLVKNEPSMKGTNFPDESFITSDWVLRQAGATESRLADKLSLFFVNESRIGVPEIGANERAIMMRTFQRGTVPGAAAQAFWQFRSYQVAMMTNLFPRMYEMGVPGVMYHSVGAMGMGYAAMSLKDLAKGLTPQPLDKPETYWNALRQSGVLGFMGDALAAEYGNYYGKLDEEIAGPVYGMGKDFLTLFADMMEDGELGWQGWKAIKANTPYANLFYTEFAYNHFINWQVMESMMPGSLRRLENWYRFERDQEYIDVGLPFINPLGRPTDFIETGGGFK